VRRGEGEKDWHKEEGDDNDNDDKEVKFSSLPLPASKRYTAPVEFAGSYLASPSSKKQFPERLNRFLDAISMPGNSIEEKGQAFLNRAKKEATSSSNNKYWAEDVVLSFLQAQVERFEKHELASASIPALLSAIKHFCQTHKRDYLLSDIDWQRLSRMLPTPKIQANDRAYTVEELRALFRFPDRRIRPLVCLLCSSGMRVGAVPHLKWKHIEPKRNEKGELLGAKVTAYNEDGDQYFCFITPESYNELEEWMRYRAKSGENITGNSPVMRDLWRTIDKKKEQKQEVEVSNNGNGAGDGGGDSGDGNKKGRHRKGGRFGIVSVPKPMTEDNIEKRLNRALKAQGLRGDLPEGDRRHEVKQTYGMRKFFRTQATGAGMIHDNVECLIGHDDPYFRPVEDKIFADYLKAVDALTIEDNQKTIWQKRLAELEEKRKEDSSYLARKLIEKEKELEAVYERNRKAVAEQVEAKFKQFAKYMQRLEAKHDRLADEFMSQNKRPLNRIKDQKKRNTVLSQGLWDAAAAAAEVELEDELEEEEAAKKAAAVKIEYDKKGNPISTTTHDSIGWSVEEEEEYDAE
jgi:integrase